MAKSNGIKSLKQAAKLLNKHSPDGESLAYINPEEAKLLRSHGGSGIQTLSGVPSYAELFGFTIPGTKGKDWGTVGSDVWNWATGRYRDEDPVYSDGKVIQPRQSGVGNLFQDAISIYAFLRAKKDAEGLNDAEMSEFNRLDKQLTASQEQFTEYTGGGEQLKAPTNVPSTIEDVSVFSEATGIPTMKTTAVAQGGRIGYNEGGGEGGSYEYNVLKKKGYLDLMKGMSSDEILSLFDSVMGTFSKAQGGRIGYYMGGIDRPFQGIGALNPGMGYTYGGRIGAQKGGIMPLLNLGGMEKDYRQDGGFVPIGRKEKADDVPARLSKNEFVFTADAVRAAGGGDIDEGAQRMYNVMKNLEAGGEISQQSQGQA